MRGVIVDLVVAVFCIGSAAACTTSGASVTSNPPASPPSAVAPRASVSPGHEADPSVPASPSVTASGVPDACLPLPHDVPDMESLLPKQIAGRPMATWSVNGERMITCIRGGSASDVADFAEVLASEGLGLDDISVGIAGRSDVTSDPPYFVFAYRLNGHRGNEFPATTGVDHPDAAAFEEAQVGGKKVLVGDVAAFDQDEHARGRPYVWNSPAIHYLVVTDDDRWAAEALRLLE